jgi:hypothetical protein
MDPSALVEGGAKGLVRIAEAFRSAGISIVAIYLIKVAGHDGDDEWWELRLVSEDKSPDLNGRMIRELVELERAGRLPWIDHYVRFFIASIDDPEASRVIDYAQQFDRLPVVIRDVMWKGLFIEHALVAMVAERKAAAA